MKKLFIIIALVICINIPVNVLAEIKVIEVIEIKDEQLYGVDVGRVCIDGYEYVIIHQARRVAITQAYVRISGDTKPKRCE